MRYSLMHSQLVNIIIPCNGKLTVGNCIRLNIENITQDNKIEKEDNDHRSGNYLIIHLCHAFTSTNSFTSLTLARDEYGLNNNNIIMANKHFHESNRKTKYGEHDVKFWIGTVVAFASQQKQIEEGFGWMYKVRVDGDHAVGADSIKDEQLSYAYSFYHNNCWFWWCV